MPVFDSMPIAHLKQFQSHCALVIVSRSWDVSFLFHRIENCKNFPNEVLLENGWAATPSILCHLRAVHLTNSWVNSGNSIFCYFWKARFFYETKVFTLLGWNYYLKATVLPTLNNKFFEFVYFIQCIFKEGIFSLFPFKYLELVTLEMNFIPSIVL